MNPLPYLPSVPGVGETRPQDTARYEQLQRSITPLWGKEGIKNARDKRANKKVVGRDLLQRAEQGRQQRLRSDRSDMQQQRSDSPTRMSVPEAPPAGYRRKPVTNQGIFNYPQQQSLQRKRQQQQQVQQPASNNRRQPQQVAADSRQQQQQQNGVVRTRQYQPEQAFQPRQQQFVRAPSPVRITDQEEENNYALSLVGGSSTAMERLMMEERTKRQLQQAELERLSALAHRNDAAIKDRSAFLEKLRLRDAVEVRELRERLRIVESELGEHRATGNPGGRSNNQRSSPRSPSGIGGLGSNNSNGSGNRPLVRSSSTGNVGNGNGNGKDSSAIILNELRVRDQRDNDAREKQEERRLELWQHNMTLQKRLEEQRQQMSEFALRSADRISALEGRLNERDASIVRLEQRETGTSQALANSEVQNEATLSSVVSSLEHLQNKLAREVEMRTKMEETYRTENSELRRLLFSTEKGIATSIESSVKQLWDKDVSDRARSKQVRDFVEQRHLHERDSVYQWAERLESTLASERNDRLRFEKELRSITELKMSAMEASANQSNTTNEMRGDDVKTKTESVLTKMLKMINIYKADADEQRQTWERKTDDTMIKLRTNVKHLSGTSGGATNRLEEVLRAEIRTRERKSKEEYEQAIERERTIDNRAKAVELSLRASVNGFDDRIRSVEERVNSALAGFRAQMENDIKTSTDSMAKMLLDLDGTTQMLSIRIDSNDAERRSSLANFNTRLAEVRRMTVSRAELDNTTDQVTRNVNEDLQKINVELLRVESSLTEQLNNETKSREGNDLALQTKTTTQLASLSTATQQSVVALKEEMVRVTDQERTERILKDSSLSDVAQDVGTQLRVEMKKMNFDNMNQTEDAIGKASQQQNVIQTRDIKRSEVSLTETMNEKINALKIRLDAKCENIVNTTGTIATEAKTNADKADQNATVALSKIDDVVNASKLQLDALSSELRTVVATGSTAIVEKAESLEKDVEERLINMESALRRSFEEQASSLRALTQANLAAEAAVRLREDTRVRIEVDSRLKEQQKWVGEFTEYKAEKIGRKLGKLVRDEATARQLATRQVHREMTYEMDQSSNASQVASALESIIGTLIEADQTKKVNHALNTISNVTSSMEQKIKTSLAKQSNADKKHLAQSLRRVQTQFTETKRETEEVRRNVEVQSVLESVLTQIIEESQNEVLKTTTKNIMNAEVKLIKTLSRVTNKGLKGLKVEITARKKEEGRLSKGLEVEQEHLEGLKDTLTETKEQLNTLEELVKGYHDGSAVQQPTPEPEREPTPEPEPEPEAEPEPEPEAEPEAVAENQWEELQDDETGATYWKNKETGEQTYEDPN